MNGWSGSLNLSLDGLAGVFSINVGITFAQDKRNEWIIGISGGGGLGYAPFKLNGYFIPTYTETWELYPSVNLKNILDVVF
ncbi:hypothetical protein GGR21_004193 [Dysgonomonas hofstadii]|uniref:Uncharacterized protein n=1 Tax=Dysgonomonas hofstadii TaxID=637886 RepID=A0A840CTC6_9BACT|nr:hypothetical protein [Dysgonomonas hofstadii]MBB4038261.1 hypothetical protein [Dysgonomonas hofstadii]